MADSWERIATRFGGTVAGLALAKAASGETTVFAATPVGVYRSTDGGWSWSLPGSAPTVPFADLVAPSLRFAQDRTLFACGADALYRSSDGGMTWQRVLVGSRMLSVAVSSDETSERLVVLAGTESDGILRSEDGGRTWTGANAGLLDLTAICLALSACFETDRTAFAGTASGVYRTRNGGRSWRSVDMGLDEPAVQCLAVSPNFASDRLVLAGTEADGLLRSVDAGATWQRPPSLTSGGVAAVAFVPWYPSQPTIAVATDSGIALSHDHGETWQTPALEEDSMEPVLSLMYVGGALIAGLHRSGIVRSENGGSTWQPALEGLSARLDTELVLSPDFESDRTLFVGGLEDGARVSRDGGMTWGDHIAGLEGLAVYSLTISGSDKTLYTATSAGIQMSRDAGLTWNPCPIADGSARSVATGPGVVVAALEGGKLLASGDAGKTWRALKTPLEGAEVISLAIAPSFARDRTIFVATAGSDEVTLWRSVDAGQRWQRWLMGTSGGLSRVPLAVASTYAIDGTVFVGIGGRVFRPLRDAQGVRAGERRPVWRSAELGQENVGVTALAVSPDYGHDRTVFATGNAGVFVSRDGGENFQPYNTGLTAPRMVSVALSPTYQTDRLVYALGLGGALWRTKDTQIA